MYKIFFLVFLALAAIAGNLDLSSGQIKAHTEIFGDSDINPTSKEITSKLTINGDIESINGTLSIDSLSLKSSKSDRDEHMYKVLHVEGYPTITFDIKNIIKAQDGYQINGTLTLNGVSKDISSQALIVSENNTVNIEGGFNIKLSDFGIEPPTLLFLTVRDQIDIAYNLTYNKVN